MSAEEARKRFERLVGESNIHVLAVKISLIQFIRSGKYSEEEEKGSPEKSKKRILNGIEKQAI